MKLKRSVLHVAYIIILHQDIPTFIVNIVEEPAGLVILVAQVMLMIAEVATAVEVILTIMKQKATRH